jgi:hypothetical protein
MRSIRHSIIFGAISSLFLAAIIALPAQAQDSNANPNTHQAQIGTINYVEGQAAIDGQSLDANSLGSVVLGRGQTLTTETGRVEVLLTPGVFLRVDHNSAVKMISPDLADTEAGGSYGHQQGQQHPHR